MNSVRGFLSVFLSSFPSLSISPGSLTQQHISMLSVLGAKGSIGPWKTGPVLPTDDWRRKAALRARVFNYANPATLR